ncbi:hypothetical protein [Cupriavidus sp. 8B]
MKLFNKQLPLAMLTGVLLISGCNFTEKEADTAKASAAAVTIEKVQTALNQKNFGQAATLADQLTAANPENADAWLIASEAKAASGNRLAALAALENALSKGMRDPARLDASNYLEPLRSSSEYRVLLQRFGLLKTTAQAGEASIDETSTGTVVRAGDVSVTLPNSK